MEGSREKPVRSLAILINKDFKGDIAVRIEDMSNITNSNNKLYEEYEKIPHINQKERSDYDKLKGNLTKYREIKNSIINYVKEEDYEKAQKLYNSEYILASNQLVESINSVIEDNITYAKDVTDLNHKIFNIASVVAIISIIVGALISLLLGFKMAVWLKRRISNVVNFANNLADGNLTQELTITAEDEIGNMGRALNVAKSEISDVRKNFGGNVVTTVATTGYNMNNAMPGDYVYVDKNTATVTNAPPFQYSTTFTECSHTTYCVSLN